MGCLVVLEEDRQGSRTSWTGAVAAGAQHSGPDLRRATYASEAPPVPMAATSFVWKHRTIGTVPQEVMESMI